MSSSSIKNRIKKMGRNLVMKRYIKISAILVILCLFNLPGDSVPAIEEDQVVSSNVKNTERQQGSYHVSLQDESIWNTYTSANHIRSLAIEGDYLWAGTTEGVVRWNLNDGSYIKYTTKDGLVHNHVFSIAIDEVGRKWFGTEDGVNVFDGSSWTSYTEGDGLIDNDVHVIVIDSTGNKWIGTSDGVSVFDGSSWVSYTTDNGLVNDSVQTIAIDTEGSLWFGTYYGLSKFDGNNWTSFTTEDGLVANNVQSIAIDVDGALWFGTTHGVSRFDGSTWTSYDKTGAYDIAIDADGIKWFGTSGGVYKFDNNTWVRFNIYNSSLETNTVKAIVIDSDGIKWFGTDGRGINKFLGTFLRTYIDDDGPVDNMIYDIAIDDDGHKWFAILGSGVRWEETGGVSEFDGYTWNSYRTGNSDLPYNYASAIVVDNEGVVWIGSYQGVTSFDGTIWRTYDDSNSGLILDYINDIAIDFDGIKWFGANGGVSSFDGNKWTSYTTEDGLIHNNVQAIEIAADGTKWFGTWEGVSSFDGSVWTSFTEEDGLVNNDVEAIGEDHDGNLWFGTYLGGVSKFDGNTWTTFTQVDGLADDDVHAIEVDTDGAIWFGTYHGVSKYDGTAWISYTESDGLAHEMVSSIAIDPSGTKWFGTIWGGVSEFIPGEVVGGYSISGRVLGPNNYPIEGADVSAGFAYHRTTDSNGYFIFSDLPAGTYNLLASKDDCTFKPAELSVTVPPGKQDVEFISPSLQICDVEINQAIGNHLDPMYDPQFVTGKDTAIRVFLNDRVWPDPNSQHVELIRNGESIIKLKPKDVFQTDELIFLCPTRADCDNWQGDGSLESADSIEYGFNISINGVDTWSSAIFHRRNNFRLLAVPVEITDLDNNNFPAPSRSQFETAWTFLSKVYPIASGALGIDWNIGHKLHVQNIELTIDGLKVIQTKLLKRQNFWCVNNYPIFDRYCYDLIIGFIPPVPIDCGQDGCIPGKSAGPGDPVVVMVNGVITYSTIDGEDKSINYGSMEAAVAHEVGHPFNLNDEYINPGSEVNCDWEPKPLEDEWDGQGNKVLSVDHPFEVIGRGALGDKLSFMGKAGVSQEIYWVSPCVYNRLNNSLIPINQSITSDDSIERVMWVSGWIFHNDNIILEPWYHFSSTVDTGTSGVYSIEAVDALENSLASKEFDVSFIALTNPPQEVDRAFFNSLVGYPLGTKAFHIKKGDTLLKIVDISDNVPEVRVISPNGGENWKADTEFTITWNGEDGDDDTLIYTVLYSPDGSQWGVLEGDVSGTQMTINSNDVPGGSFAKIQVVATDGINTSVDESDNPFTVESKRPDSLILSPLDGSSILLGTSFYLQGYAYDLEDKALDDNSYSWKSDVDGELGTGSLVLVNLSPGEHMITLTVKDSDGNKSTATTSIYVGSKLFIPLTLR